MSKYIAPGVYVRERDFSLYVPNLSTTIVGMVGTASKGPVDTPTLITNVPQFVRTFGNPSPSHYMPYAALQFLRRGTMLWVVRVSGTTSVTADASFNAYRPANIVSTDADQAFTIVAGTDDTLRVIVTDERTNPVTTYDDEITLAAGTYTAATMAAEIADKLKAIPGLALMVTAIAHEDTLKIVAKVASPQVKLQIAAASAQDAATALGLPVAAEQAGTLVGTFTLEATSAGVHGNYLSVQIFQQDGFTFDINVYESTPASDYGYLIEVFKGVSLDDSSSKWIGTVLGTPAEAGDSVVLNLQTSPADTIPVADDLLVPEAKTTTLSGGDDGLASVLAGDYIGISSPVKTGLQLFRSPQEIDLNLILVPGITIPAVLNEAISICEERADCMAILDTPDNYSPQEVVDWHNGVGAFGDHQAFNSSYAAMYWPWVQIYDPYNNAEVWTPPSGHMAAVYAYTDFIADTWWAPAGFNRGHLTSGKNTRYVPDKGEIEHLYGNQNAINPIVKFPKEGIVVWGQRTLQRKPTALDRVNVRRLFLYAEKVIATAVKYLLFEPNDPATWRSFIRLVTPFLESIKNRRGLYDFRVICDETTNTPDLIDQNVMKGVILLKPTKAAEYIVVDFAATATGVKFDELSDLIY